jgi:hypothetical protein
VKFTIIYAYRGWTQLYDNKAAFSFKSSGSDRAALLSGCFLAQFFDQFAASLIHSAF